MNTAKTPTPPTPTPLPWWRFGIVWLVFGGPAVVVVAACVTGVIAARGADPVLSAAERNASTADATSTSPALQARNHAATPQR